MWQGKKKNLRQEDFQTRSKIDEVSITPTASRQGAAPSLCSPTELGAEILRQRRLDSSSTILPPRSMAAERVLDQWAGSPLLFIRVHVQACMRSKGQRWPPAGARIHGRGGPRGGRVCSREALLARCAATKAKRLSELVALPRRSKITYLRSLWKNPAPPPPCNYIPPHWTWNVLSTFIGFKIHSNGFWQRPGFHILGNLLEVEMESSCSLQRIAHHWVQPLTGASLPAFTFTSSCCDMTTLTTHLVYRWKQRSKMNVWKQATMGPL